MQMYLDLEKLPCRFEAIEFTQCAKMDGERVLLDTATVIIQHFATHKPFHGREAFHTKALAEVSMLCGVHLHHAYFDQPISAHPPTSKKHEVIGVK